MKNFLFLILILINTNYLFCQNLTKTSITDKDYVGIVNFYIKTDYKPIKFLNTYDSLTRVILLPNGKYDTSKNIVNNYGRDYLKCLNQAIKKDAPIIRNDLHEDYFAIVKKEYYINKNQMITGAIIFGTSTVMQTLTNTVLNDLMDNANNINQYNRLRKSKTITNYIYCGISITGIIISLASIKKKYIVNKNYDFDINGSVIQYTQHF